MKRFIVLTKIFINILFFTTTKDAAAQKLTGLLTYDSSNKIRFVDSIKLVNEPFQLAIKKKLAKHAVQFNAGIVQQVNKMENYIVYEDSTLIVANLKIKTEQFFQRSLWNIEVTFKKRDSNITYTLENITMLKNQNSFMGQTDGGVPIEAIDSKFNAGLIKAFIEEVNRLNKNIRS